MATTTTGTTRRTHRRPAPAVATAPGAAPVVLDLAIDDFLAWVQRGVRLTRSEEAVRVPLASQEARDRRVLAELPPKYTAPLAASGRVLALIDDVEAVSLASAGLTDEWRHRMANMGEGWLPFVFRPEWLAPAAPVPSVRGAGPRRRNARVRAPHREESLGVGAGSRADANAKAKAPPALDGEQPPAAGTDTDTGAAPGRDAGDGAGETHAVEGAVHS